MWSLGKVVKTPECVRVYIGSFWDQPLTCNEWSRQLLEAEMRDLLTDLKNVPKNAAVRKVNELVKRCRLAKAHAFIVGHLKKEMPSMFGKDKAQAKLLGNLEEHFLKVHRTCHLPVGDFPDVAKFRGVMESHDLAKFPKVDMKLIDGMETVLAKDIPRLMSMFPQEGAGESTQVTDASPTSARTSRRRSSSNTRRRRPPRPRRRLRRPPRPRRRRAAPAPWAISAEDKARYDQVFTTLQQDAGRASGATVRPVLERSGLSVDMLRTVWNLSDIDRDGHLDADEFAVAMHLCREATTGKPLPPTLPPNLVPPSKR